MTKKEIFNSMIYDYDYDKIEIDGIYIVPTNVIYDDDSVYGFMQLIGYNYDENNKQIRYYDLGDLHDAVSLINFGLSGVSICTEIDNGFIKVFWNDGKPRKIKWLDAQFSVFTIKGEEI